MTAMTWLQWNSILPYASQHILAYCIPYSNTFFECQKLNTVDQKLEMSKIGFTELDSGSLFYAPVILRSKLLLGWNW